MNFKLNLDWFAYAAIAFLAMDLIVDGNGFVDLMSSVAVALMWCVIAFMAFAALTGTAIFFALANPNTRRTRTSIAPKSNRDWRHTATTWVAAYLLFATGNTPTGLAFVTVVAYMWALGMVAKTRLRAD